MSTEATLVTEALFRYVRAHAAGDDRFLKDLKEAARDAGLPAIWISREQASLMQVLLRLSGSREVVEVGTLAGYSAIIMARALPSGGRIRTVEVDPGHAAFAREWVRRSGVAERVEVIQDDGARVLAGLPDASLDALFVDADKQGQPGYLREAVRVLRPKGLFMVDNAFAFGRVLETSEDPDVQAVQGFNKLMAASPDLQGVIVPVGDGLWVAVRAES